MPAAAKKVPRIALDDAARIAADLYGLNTTVSTLPSERDQNFFLQTESGERYVLKIANAEEDFDFLNFQNELIQFLAARQIDLKFPRIAPTRAGKNIASITTPDSQKHFVRLLTCL